MNDPQAPATSVQEVLSLFERFGAQNYDEDLSQTEHALQTAALAGADGASDELVAAALLHDVGHLLDMATNDGRRGPADHDLEHESVGARYLAGLFGPDVTGPIALHVRAKRYRCAVDPAYLDGLSDGSRRSLVEQGGPYVPAETVRFEANPSAVEAVRLRAWDDGGKAQGLMMPGLEHYRPLLERLTTPGPT